MNDCKEHFGNKPKSMLLGLLQLLKKQEDSFYTDIFLPKPAQLLGTPEIIEEFFQHLGSLQPEKFHLSREKSDPLAILVNKSDIPKKFQATLKSLQSLFKWANCNESGIFQLAGCKGVVVVFEANLDDKPNQALLWKGYWAHLKSLPNTKDWFPENSDCGVRSAFAIPFYVCDKAKDGGTICLLFGREKGKERWQFPLGGTVALGADTNSKETCEREWAEESMGDAFIKWGNFFSVPINHKRVHSIRYLYDFYFVPVYRNSVYGPKYEKRNYYDIVPTIDIAEKEDKETLSLYHNGHAEFFEMDRLAWVRLEVSQNGHHLALCAADMRSANEGKVFPQSEAFMIDTKALMKSARTKVLSTILEEWPEPTIKKV
eukprot:TRINITY_DN8611_c0_g1_i1.p1 TRINITY_DN8611_c0_g1~~TRINITY_DN8611_c0_g1_i1.p1  ORF type:complete len:373 (+),score=49.79 TRINITY_DN8611_c0_g1_i1:211-1329(+)